jgi:hypothetical protein
MESEPVLRVFSEWQRFELTNHKPIIKRLRVLFSASLRAE